MFTPPIMVDLPGLHRAGPSWSENQVFAILHGGVGLKRGGLPVNQAFDICCSVVE